MSETLNDTSGVFSACLSLKQSSQGMLTCETEEQETKWNHARAFEAFAHIIAAGI